MSLLSGQTEECAMKQILTLVALAGAAMLAACGGDEERGGVTAEEARQLDNAAEMLDASPDSLVASEEMPLGNGEEPAANVSETVNGSVTAPAPQ
jgi:hypothetical protein